MTEESRQQGGSFPIDWRTMSIGDAFEMQLGKMLSKASKIGRSPKPYLGNKNVQWDRVDLSDLETMDFTVSEKEKFSLRRGDLLVCEGGEVGRSCIWRDEVAECYFQKAIHRLRPKTNDIIPVYMLRLMRLAADMGWFTAFTSQSSIAHLTREKLAVVQVCVPCRSEQRKIARILTSLDNLIEKTESLNAKYQAIKQGMMHDLFTRGVDAHGHLRPPQTEAPDLYKQSELGWIPMEWKVCPLSAFASDSPSAFVNGPFGSDLLTTELTQEGVPVIYVRDIKPGKYERVSTVHVTEQKAKRLSACNVILNDVVVAKVGDPPCDAAPYLNCWRSIVTQDVMRIRPSKDVDTFFLSHLLNSPMGRDAIRHITIDGTRARVSLTALKSLRLPKPSLPEQELLAARLESLLNQIRTETSIVQKYKNAKTGLMQELLTGKVRVKVDDAAEVAHA